MTLFGYQTNSTSNAFCLLEVSHHTQPTLKGEESSSSCKEEEYQRIFEHISKSPTTYPPTFCTHHSSYF